MPAERMRATRLSSARDSRLRKAGAGAGVARILDPGGPEQLPFRWAAIVEPARLRCQTIGCPATTYDTFTELKLTADNRLGRAGLPVRIRVNP